MTPSTPPFLLRIRLVPWVEAMGSLVLMAAAIAVGSTQRVDPSGEGVIGMCVLFTGAVLLAILSYFRRGTLRIDTHIGYRRGRIQFQLSHDHAVEVFIRRPPAIWPLKGPTDYSLRVRIDDDTYLLPFAEHWLSGSVAMRKAKQVAHALGVPVTDPQGASRRASRVFLVRWLGAGQEWKLVILGVVGGLIALLVSLSS